MNLQEVLSHFDGVKRRNENEYMARCPCHDDKKQSLCIGNGEKGVVLKCQAGCDTRAILDRVGLKPADLFFEKKQNSRPQVTATYQYPNGVQKLRRSDKSFTWRRPDGKGGWIYNRKGVPHSLYIAGEVSKDVAIVEGEKDADNLHIAIRNNQKVRFFYFHYNARKLKWYSHDGAPYIVSPFGLLWSDGNYYLYAYDGEKFRHFRVDRMEHITVYPEPREGAEAFKRIDLNAHQAQVFHMFTGTETTVKLRCANHLADVILEQFGKDTMLIPDGEDAFTVSVPVQISKPFYAWAAGFGADMKILFPQAIVNEMRAFIQELSELYQDDGKM